MNTLLNLIGLLLFALPVYAGEILHHFLTEAEKGENAFVWEGKINPSDELIISWDAIRPSLGSYLIQVSVYTSEWTPWADYAFWGAEDQHTFKRQLANIQVYQDAVEVLNGHKATGFRIRVTANEIGSLNGFKQLHLSAIDRSTHQVDGSAPQVGLMDLPVKGLSQMALEDERCERVCSPTSTTAVVRFLSPHSRLEPLTFADRAYDTAFDIYGNWILNTAQASHELETKFQCYVCRLSSFSAIIDQLQKGLPVVVSIKGPLVGTASPYASGHLLVVKGYDPKEQQVLCMDPAFSSDELTHVKYPLQDFVEAWGRKMGIAYIFSPRCGRSRFF